MKTPNDLFNRLKRMMPAGTRPKFTNGEELLALEPGTGAVAFRSDCARKPRDENAAYHGAFWDS